MKVFKNIAEARIFCRENDISFIQGNNKQTLIDKIQTWRDGELARVKIEEVEVVKEVEVVDKYVFNAYEFGQIYKLDKSMITYLKKCFGNKKNTYDNWIQVCKDKKVID